MSKNREMLEMWFRDQWKKQEKEKMEGLEIPSISKKMENENMEKDGDQK